MAKPRALIMTGYGLNCEEETAYAFEIAGALPEQVHLSEILSKENKITNYQILTFIGGFSFGDHIAAGTVQAAKFRYGLEEELQSFIEKGGLAIGICNGFQTMVKLGLLPGIENNYKTQAITLAENDSGRFYDGWVRLRVNTDSPCVFTKRIEKLYLPVRHGEGKVVARYFSVIERLKEDNQIVLQYTDKEGKPTMEYPANPNGSLESIAGVCDPTGRIFGLMPHPEAYLFPYNHPTWTRLKVEGKPPKEGDGVNIFRNAVDYFR